MTEHECILRDKLQCDTMDLRMRIAEKRLDSIDNKIWAIIMLLIANLGGIIGIFLKG